MNNEWGEPDDIEPFPDWMLPDNHPHKGINKRVRGTTTKSLEKIAEEVLTKPLIPVRIENPGDLK
jgi:hypothetical protein